MNFQTALAACPLIAILRGVRPDEVVGIAATLIEAGFQMIEVPMNSPSPLESIAALQTTYGDRALIGAGTVLTTNDVEAIAKIGGKLIVMPHSDLAVIRAAHTLGLTCAPGVMTPSEGFAALAAGADALKLFPAEQMGPMVLKAWRSVFPTGTQFIPVGGITPDNMAPWQDAGAAGFGLGSALYRKGDSADVVGERARRFVAALHGN